MLLLWFNYCNRAEKDVNLALIYNTKWSLKSSIDGENTLSKSITKYSLCDRESQFTIPKLIKFFWNLYYQDKNAKIKKKKYLPDFFSTHNNFTYLPIFPHSSLTKYVNLSRLKIKTIRYWIIEINWRFHTQK